MAAPKAGKAWYAPATHAARQTLSEQKAFPACGHARSDLHICVCLCIYILGYACIAASLSSEIALSDKYTPANYVRTTRLNYEGSEEVGEVGMFWGKSPVRITCLTKPPNTYESLYGRYRVWQITLSSGIGLRYTDLSYKIQ